MIAANTHSNQAQFNAAEQQVVSRASPPPTPQRGAPYYQTPARSYPPVSGKTRTAALTKKLSVVGIWLGAFRYSCNFDAGKIVQILNFRPPRYPAVKVLIKITFKNGGKSQYVCCVVDAGMLTPAKGHPTYKQPRKQSSISPAEQEELRNYRQSRSNLAGFAAVSMTVC